MSINCRPILFSAPMVRAILEGRKTQTRRIAKLLLPGDKNYIFSSSTDEWASKRAAQCSYGNPSDRLWVREAWGIADRWLLGGEPTDPPRCIAYRANLAARCFDPEYDVNTSDWGFDSMKWKPSIHMPRWASRITLEITGVRVERLHDISDADAIAEGVDRTNTSIPGFAIERYKHIWESINGPSSWDANPWVWVIEFKRIIP